ncbi:hypothetical protein ACHAWO_011251 [Cyclotella atomus]|uniref:Uncharacterized protein n=1 Tax=Cyclotella atomus TaxID=382360 RepID=A0ABD3P9N6_9STRA
MPIDQDAEYYSVAIIGSSGGGTATLGHSDPVELLTTIHRELLRVCEEVSAAPSCVNDGAARKRRVCLGLSHAIFISLCDGGGFDAVGEEDWQSNVDVSKGPEATLYTVGFDQSNEISADDLIDRFQVDKLATGPLSKVNTRVKQLDGELASDIQSEESKIRGIISTSSKPSLFHETLTRASLKSLPMAGSGGTSLSILASTYDMKIIGNSGGSVATTTLTKARGWGERFGCGVGYEV